MERGILILAFGKEYDQLAAATVNYSRQFTQLPIYILTNMSKESRDVRWDTIDNVQFKTFSKSQDHNRRVKTRMDLFTPFEKTLYLDCDAAIQKTGIEQAFDLIPNNGLLLNQYMRWEIGDKVYRLYHRAMRRLQVQLPLDIYNGALIGWNKCVETDRFFEVWHKFWRLTGCGRDMPALACAVKAVNMKVTTAPPKFFDPGGSTCDRDAIIQHHYNCICFYEQFNLSDTFCKYKPFDNDADGEYNKSDWSWIPMNYGPCPHWLVPFRG